MKTIDYHILLKKYMQWVAIFEGTTFVVSIINTRTQDFSKEELDVLRYLDSDLLRPPEHKNNEICPQ